MATFTVTVPDTIAIGRNAEHGNVAILWDNVPQHVKDHIAAVYFPQYVTDAANSGGKGSSGEDRLELAQKKVSAMYMGVIRSRSASEPADPVEAEAYRIVRPIVTQRLLSKPEAKQCPKGTKDRAQWVLDAMDAAANREPREVDDLVAALIEADPQYRAEAKRRIAVKAKIVASDEGLDAIIGKAE